MGHFFKNMKIESKYIKAYFSNALLDNQIQKKPKSSFFEKGKEYILKGVECDDFSMPSRKYVLIDTIDSYEGINIDSVIMKQIDGPNSSMIFSLTKNDCKKIGIEFQPQLQLFPKSLEWIKVGEEKKNKDKLKQLPIFFDENDLSTYPVDFQTKKIKNMAVKISGFLPSCNDLSNLEVCINSSTYTPIPYRIITKHVTKTDCLVDEHGNVYVELSFNNGLKPNSFKNVKINDIIEVFLR